MPEIPLVPALWRFPAHPASVRRARLAVAEALPYDLRPHLGDDLGLLTSELVTNAIRHGSHPNGADVVELVLWPADGHYWIAVSDPAAGSGTCTHPPAAAHPDPDAETGRGLILVDRLATAWTVRPRPARGTSVVAGLPLQRGG